MDEFFVNAHVLQRAVEYLAQCFLRDILDGSLHVALIFLKDGIDLPEDHLVLVLAEGYDTTVMDILLAVWDDFRQVDLVDDAQSLTMGTSPLGRVEGEVIGCRV